MPITPLPPRGVDLNQKSIRSYLESIREVTANIAGLNAGTAGVGPYISALDGVISLKNIYSSDALITVTDNTTDNQIDLALDEANIDHNSLLNYSADRHIAHSGVSITAGDGLTGGGTIDSTRTLDISTSDLVSVTPEGGDKLILTDNSDADALKRTTIAMLSDFVSDYISTGTLVQTVNVTDGEVATGTTIIPYDDTIPQNTEGTEFMTLEIIPTNASSKLEIIVNAVVSYSSSTTITMALFQDTTADALAAIPSKPGTSNEEHQVTLRHYMTAGVGSATTFKVRIGTSGAGTVTFNGDSSVRRYGGVSASSITIKEYTT